MPPTHPVSNRLRRIAVLYAIFFVSGFCGLIYESIWSHYLKLILGHAAYAQAVVLVVFVGGLALGAWLTGRFSERIRRPILAYAAVEAAVALIAFGFQGVFERASAWASSEFLPSVCNAGVCPASWLLAAALILPPSILLGTTFPLMSAGVIRLGVQPGRGLSLLYFLNSAGAALGVLASGFVLIGALGLPGTIVLAGCCNALVAVAAWLADTTAQRGATRLDAAAARKQPAPDLRPLLAVAALTGLSSFIYEVVWIRMLTLVLGAATHSFELMLAPFIFGLAIGAWWIRDRIEATDRPLQMLAMIQVAMGVLAMATLPLYGASFDGMALALKALARTEQGYLMFNAISGSLAAAVMLPAAICAGMTLPLITAILLRNGGGERQVGQVYGVNTFGAIAGVLLTVHALIPLFGLQWSLAVGAAIDVLLGLWLWGKALARRSRAAPPYAGKAWLAGVGAAACAVIVGVPFAAGIDPLRLASGVFRYGDARVDRNDHTIIFHRDGKTATITVTEQSGGTRALITNGKSDGVTHPHGRSVTLDDHTTILLGALGPIHHPKGQTAAVIGLGTGTSSAVLLESQAIRQLDTIEIEPMVVEAAQLFRPRNAKVFDDPRSRIVIDDARAHFSKTRARYDIVVSEPSNPWVSGVAGLFTAEFYAHVAAHLAPDGHFVQWLHVYEASPELVGSIVEAFAQVFPEFKAYLTTYADVALVARNDGKPPRLDLAALDRMPHMRERLLEIGITDGAVLAAHEAGPAHAIRLLARSHQSPPNSDYFPYVDQRAAGDRFRNASARAIFALRESSIPMLDFAEGVPAWASQVKEASERMPVQVRNSASSWHGHRFLTGQELERHEVAYLGPFAEDYAVVRAWAQDCRFPRGTGRLWESMVNVAIDLNPGLDAATAAGWWRSIAEGKCRGALGPAQKSWLDLFAAVGARNPQAMREPAEWLLKNDPELGSEARAYAALAAISANQAVGRRSEAMAILEEQRAKLPEGRVDSTPFRYLTMLLAAGK